MNKICSILLLIALLAAQTYAANPLVYRVLADETKLSGFRLRGTKGIVTALHGVIGKTNVRAISSADNKALIGLTIKQVDVAHDLALLANDKLSAADESIGLVPAAEPNWAAAEKLVVIGYPKEIVFTELRTKVQLRDPPRRILKELVGLEKFEKLKKRASPDPRLSVASIQGDLLPGHSGAPIVDSLQRVVAIGNGGLLDGISWGIPLEDITWSPVESVDADTLNRLKKHAGLFSTVRVLSAPIALSELVEKNGSTTAKASGKVSWLPKNEGIRIDVNLYVRKSGINGKGYAFARVDLLDERGNTVWSTPIWQTHKGASVLKGVAENTSPKYAVAPARLRDEVTGAVLTVRAEDDDGFSDSLKEFFEDAGKQVQHAVQDGGKLPDFQRVFSL